MAHYNISLANTFLSKYIISQLNYVCSFRFLLMNFTSKKEGGRSTLVPPFRGNTEYF